MVMCPKRFNIYLVLTLAAILGFGCQTGEGKHKKQLSSLRFYLEVNSYSTNRTQTVAIPRVNPVKITVETEPFLTEANIKQASVVDALGGFALRVEFERQGAWLLEEYSAANRGKLVAIFSRFIDPVGKKLNEGRWIAAPRISKRISDGVLIFTPDATREEAEQISYGLTDIGKKLERDAKW